MAQAPQSLKNHVRMDPAYHAFLVPLALLLLIGAVVNVVRNPGWSGAYHLAAAVWAFVASFKLRSYPLKVQDRVIRLEERLRLKELLPATLQARIGELSEGQLIGLRFASDGEVAELVGKTLDNQWKGKQVKEAIRTWRPDYFRV